MNREMERTLRHEAESLRARGVLTWDARLRASGLDPEQWSHVTTAGNQVTRAAPLDAVSYNAADNTVEVTWTTGAAVQRTTYDGTAFLEVLDVSATSVRLGRLNAGAPFLNTHSSDNLSDVIGSVVPGSARVAGGKGSCRILLSTDPSQAGIVGNIKSGVIRNVSVGYRIYAGAWAEKRDGSLPTYRVTDWEPLEISAVPIPADYGAQVRGRA